VKPGATTAPASRESLIGQSPALMGAGVVGSHLFLAVAVIVAGLLGGRGAMLSALLAGLTVSVVVILGQYLQLLLVQRATVAAMMTTLLGFSIRAVALAGALGLWLSSAKKYPALVPWAIVTGCVVVTVGWIVGVLYRYARLHVPIYDQPYEPPSSPEDGEV
jgi:hypothetical protein